MKTTHITKELKAVHGTEESVRMYVITTVHSGETEIVIEKTISQRMPVQYLEKAENMFEKLTCGGGRRVYTLEDLIEEKIK